MNNSPEVPSPTPRATPHRNPLARSHARRYGYRAVALMLGAVSAVLLTELLLRLLGVASTAQIVGHPFRGRAYRPNTDYRFSGEGLHQTIHINSRGFRDDEWSLEKPPRTFRIAVLGDSYVEAPQVAVPDRFTERLVLQLSQSESFAGQTVEVLNFGVSTYGTLQELQTLRHDVWIFQPDLVLLCLLTGNDLQNNCRELVDEDDKPYLDWNDGQFVEFPPRGKGRASQSQRLMNTVLGRSRIWALKSQVQYQYKMWQKRRQEAQLYRFPDGPASTGIEAGLDLAVYRPPETTAWDHAWQITEELLRRFDQECRDHHTDWVLVTLSNGIQVHPDAELRENFRRVMKQDNLFYPDERLAAAAARDGYSVLSLAPLLLETATREQVTLHGFENMQIGFGHWNEHGHLAAAQQIARYLAARHKP